MVENKQVFIGDCIAEVHKGSKKKLSSIKIDFTHTSYLSQRNRDVEGLISGLMQQTINSFSIKMPIRNLTISWDEYPEDFGE